MAQALNQTAIIAPLHIEPIEGSRMVKLIDSMGAYSRILRRAIWIHPPFVFDLESLPWLRGLNPFAGGIHDASCRKDFCAYAGLPIGSVTKKVAADLYMEFLEYGYSLDDRCAKYGRIHQAWDDTKVWGKYHTVLYWPGYFHKHNMNATYEEMAGVRQ